MPNLTDRRRFLQAAAGAMTASSWSRVLGANDRVRLGVIGPGGRGRAVMQRFINTGAVDVRALCDIWSTQVDAALQMAPGAKGYRDHRKMLESEKLDAVLVATPDHWHALTAMDAMNAGLDVYVEKPLSLTIEEGWQVVKTARVNGRICQVGTQGRSTKQFLQLKREYFDSGKLGKIQLVRTWYNGNLYHARQAPEHLKTQPDNLDWARFLGPLRWREWDPQQYWNWRAYLEYGGGQIGDLFVHLIDITHLFLRQEIPSSAVASGGIYFYKDGRTAPDTITVGLEYPGEHVVTFEGVVNSAANAGLEFLGERGRLYIDWHSRGKTTFYPAEKGAPPVEVLPGGEDGTLDHVQNFLDCVRSRKLPNADVLIGQRSSQAAHLGNIAYLQKRRISFDPTREEILPR